MFQFEKNCMDIMPGTTLNDLDKTDIETLLPYYFWYISHTEKDKTSGNIIERGGRKYKRVDGSADWVNNIF